MSGIAAGIPYGVYLQMPLIVVCCTIPLFLILSGFFLYQSQRIEGTDPFGKYVGSVRDNGFYWANPFYGKKNLLRARNFESERVKVNDKEETLS